jgi:DNA-binding SARP family transcriptional activator/tetratricopeptide (TPR) repeat protein
VEFKLLGAIGAEASGRPIPLGPPRQRGILAALAADAGRLVLMDTLVDRVWGDSPPDRARHSLYAYVARLRGILAAAGGSTLLVRRTRGYLLDVDQDAVDLHRFRQLVVQAREPRQDLPARTALLRAALAQWRGTPLAEMPGEWADATRQAWQRQHLDVVVQWAEAEQSMSGPAAVMDTLTGMLTEHPLHEPLAGALMRALHAAGRTGEALDVYARIRARLVEQLGVDPSAPLRRVHQDVLRSDADLRAVDRVVPAQVSALYERDGQLAMLHRLAGQARAGRGSVVLVRGAAGMGKTALLDAWAEREPAGAMRVRRATAGQPEQGVAFAVVRQLLEPLAGTGQTVPAVDSDPQHEVMHSLYHVVARACEQAPLALVVDDAHWADPPSLRWLDYLARRVGGLSVLLVVAARPEGGPVEQLAGPVITLPPLSPAAVARWVRREWPDAADEFCAACAAAAGGDPSLLTGLLRELRERGVEPAADQVPRVAECAGPLLAAVVARRLAGQDDATRRLARALVVLGDDADWPVAAALSGLAEAQSREPAERLRRIGMLVAGRTARFGHPSIRPALAETAMSPAELATGHARAAELLYAQNAPAEQVAEHLLLAEPGSGSWQTEVLREAARSAQQRGVPADGVRYLRHALRVPVSAEHRADLVLELGSDAVLSDPEAAARRLVPVLRETSDPLSRARVASLLAEALPAVYQYDQAREVLERALADLGEPAGPDGPVREVWLHLQAQLMSVLYERPATFAAARRLADRLRAFDVAGDTPGQRAVLLALVKPAMRGESNAATVDDLLDRGLRGEVATDARAPRILELAGRAYTLTDRLDDAALRYTQLRDLSARHDAAVPVARAVAGLANVEWCRGEQIPHVAPFEGALRTDLRARLSLLTVALNALVERGDPEAAAAVFAQHAEGEPIDSAPWAPVLAAAGRMQAECGDLRGALALLMTYGRYERKERLGNPASAPWRSTAARICAALGQHEQARELADEGLAKAHQWGTPRVIGAALRCLGTVTGGTQGRRLLAEAVTVLETSPARRELAWATYEWGLAERQTGDVRAGLSLLGDALKLAELSDSRLLAGRVRAELVATGVRLSS